MLESHSAYICYKCGQLTINCYQIIRLLTQLSDANQYCWRNIENTVTVGYILNGGNCGFSLNRRSCEWASKSVVYFASVSTGRSFQWM